MNISAFKVDPPPNGVSKPKSLNEAIKRYNKAEGDLRDINLQRNMSNKTDKTGRRLNLAEWELWRSQQAYNMRRMNREMSYMKYWIKEARTYIRALDVGIENHRDPTAHLSVALRLLRSVRKCEALPKDLHSKTGRVADAVETYLKREAEVA